MKKFIFLSIFLFCVYDSTAQDSTLHWGAVAGVSSTELIHVGITRQINQSNTLGISVGSAPYLNFFLKHPFTLSVEHRLRLCNSKNKTHLPTWYLGQQLSFYKYSNADYDAKALFAILAIGRRFYFNKNSGMSIDIGVRLLMDDLHAIHEFNPNSRIRYTEQFGPIPNLKIQYFYQL